MTRRGIALIVILASPSLLTAQDATTPFVVGVWGQGDAVIPFADFDGRSWRTSWPAPVDTEPDSRRLEQIPASWWGRSTFQPRWELLEPSGRRLSIQLTGTTAAGLGSGCSSNLGLKTSAPAGTYQYGTVLAASRPGVVEPVEVLTPDIADWRTLSASLLGIYQRHEATAWKEVSEDFRPDMSAPLSRPKLDAAFMFKDELGEYAYFESSREFRRRPEQQGGERSFITGWLWRRSSTMSFQLVTVKPGTNDGDGKGSASFHPLGVVRNGSRRFWLGSLWLYAYRGLTVLDVRRAAVKQVLLVDYPGC
jgi:hypothetical protein